MINETRLPLPKSIGDASTTGRQAAARKRRTTSDWAEELPTRWKVVTRTARRSLSCCDNLDAHAPGTFYETPARALVRRIEFRCAPKRGNWLNVAENELGSMTRRCPRRDRLGNTLRAVAWAIDVNERQRGVAWES